MRKVTEEQRRKAYNAANRTIAAWGYKWEEFWADRRGGEAVRRRRLVIADMLSHGLYCIDVAQLAGLYPDTVRLLAKTDRYEREMERRRNRGRKKTLEKQEVAKPFEMPERLRHTDEAKYAMLFAEKTGMSWGNLWKHKGKGGPRERQVLVVRHLRKMGFSCPLIATMTGRLPITIRQLDSEYARMRNSNRCRMKRDRSEVCRQSAVVESMTTHSITEISKHLGVSPEQARREIEAVTIKLRNLLAEDPYIKEWLKEHPGDDDEPDGDWI